MTDAVEEVARQFGVTTRDLPKFKETRDPELIKAHDILGREIVKSETARIKNLIKEHPDWRIPAPKPEAAYEYATDVLTKSVFLGFVITMILYSDRTYQRPIMSFVGGGGGLGPSDSATRGTCFFNYPWETLITGWEANFEMNLFPLGSNVNLWGMQKEYIGSYAGGGASIAGVFGGRGKFLPPPGRA